MDEHDIVNRLGFLRRLLFYPYVGIDGLIAAVAVAVAWILAAAKGIRFNPLFWETFTLFSPVMFLFTLIPISYIALMVYLFRARRHFPAGHKLTKTEFRDVLRTSFLSEPNIVAYGRSIALLFLLSAAVSTIKSLIIIYNPRNYDPLLLHIDMALFGGHDPFRWMSQFRPPWLLALMDFGYISLFLMFCLTLTMLFVQRRIHGQRLYVMSLLLAYLTCYAISMALPTVGDVYMPARRQIYETLPPDILTRQIQFSLHDNARLLLKEHSARAAGAIDQRRSWSPAPFGGISAFPSMHCAQLVILLAFAWRYHRWLLILYIPIGILLTISTMYFGWHYFSDILIGWLIGLLAIQSARLLLRMEARLVEKPLPAS